MSGEQSGGHALLDKDEAYAKVVDLGSRLNAMVAKTYEIQRECTKVDSESRYLQDYVGNVMSTEMLKSKK